VKSLNQSAIFKIRNRFRVTMRIFSLTVLFKESLIEIFLKP